MANVVDADLKQATTADQFVKMKGHFLVQLKNSSGELFLSNALKQTLEKSNTIHNLTTENECVKKQLDVVRVQQGIS